MSEQEVFGSVLFRVLYCSAERAVKEVMWWLKSVYQPFLEVTKLVRYCFWSEWVDVATAIIYHLQLLVIRLYL